MITPMKGRKNMEFEKTLPHALEAKYLPGVIRHAALHVHYEYSMDDAIQKTSEGIKRNAELHARKVVITDHGTCMGWDDFQSDATKIGVAPIFGVEAYLRDPVTNKNAHLCIYAKDNEGLKQICKTMARGEFLEDGRCILHDENLEGLRGGHVIVTSACISGVFGSVILFNTDLKQKIAKLQSEIDEMADTIAEYQKLSKEVENAQMDLALKKVELSETKKAAKTSFAAKQKSIDGLTKKLEKARTAFDKFLTDGKETSARTVRTSLANFEINVDDPDDFEEAIEKAADIIQQRQALINSEAVKAQELAATLPAKEAAVEIAKQQLAELKVQLEPVAKEAAKVETKEAKKAELSARVMSQKFAKEHVDSRVRLMLDVFGKDFYMEMQYHGIENEKNIYPWEYTLAKKHGIPLVAANDAHMTNKSDNDMRIRQIRRSCRFKKWEDEQVGDSEMYVKDDRELALALIQILPEKAVEEAMDNVGVIIDQCNASIEKGSHAPKAKVSNVKDEIVRLARENIKTKYGDSWEQKHEERFNYEIGIIDSMGFSDYFYITWDILNVARKIGALSYEKLDELKKIMSDMNLTELLEYLDQYGTEINLSVGLGRGSGAGSIVCYLLGITNIDPFKYDLLFEREKDCVH